MTPSCGLEALEKICTGLKYILNNVFNLWMKDPMDHLYAFTWEYDSLKTRSFCLGAAMT